MMGAVSEAEENGINVTLTTKDCGIENARQKELF